MGMDYKRAWTLIDSLNRALDTPVVERVTGGSGGGGAILTPFGADLLARYRRLEAAAEKLGVTDLKALERHALPDAGPKVDVSPGNVRLARPTCAMVKLP